MQQIFGDIKPEQILRTKGVQPRRLLLFVGGLGVLIGVWVPLPSAVVDILLGLSMGGAAVLLLQTTRLQQCTQLLCFPSLLLGLTLFRLTLNLSTTRLILGEHHAGEMIDAVGRVTLGGHAGVGWVMFALMVAVQFFVVTKGAQRAAEVGARFALDALPGEQAAIEAELRSGRLTMSQAACKRQRLSERCELLGRLDAAMRCVQGDVMVGMVIIVVNVVAGMGIGVTQAGMSVSEAWHCFGLLTVGDGLLSQIPALMTGLAAAVMVTKVEQKATLHGQGSEQGSPVQDPAVWWMPATGLLLLSLCPGLPAWPNLVPALLFFGIGCAIWRTKHAKAIPDRLREVCEIHAHPEHLVKLRTIVDRPRENPTRRASSTLRSISACPEIVMELEAAWGFPAPALRWVVREELGERVLFVHGPVELFCVEARAIISSKDGVSFILDKLGQHREVFLSRVIVQAAFARLREEHGNLIDEVLNVLELRDGLAIARAFAREGLRLPPMDLLMRAWLEMPAKLQCACPQESYRAIRNNTRAYWLPARWQEIQARLDIAGARRLGPDFAQAVELGYGGRDCDGGVTDEKARQWVQALMHVDGREPAYLEVERSPTRSALQRLLREQGLGHCPVLSRGDLRGLGAQDPGPAPELVELPGCF